MTSYQHYDIVMSASLDVQSVGSFFGSYMHTLLLHCTVLTLLV